MEKPRIFLNLDALRGTAAVAILTFHTSHFWGTLLFLHGYIAVDFFFMLSGFVLSFAYQEKIDQGGFFWTFTRIRLVRLYPLYLLGLLLGFSQLILALQHHPGLCTPFSITLMCLCGLMLLPVPPNTATGGPAAFPLNSPSWSLFGEIVANLMHALLLRQRSTFFLISALVVTYSVRLYLVLQTGGVGYGWTSSDIWLGLTRVMPSYIAGMLLYRLHRTGKITLFFPTWVSSLLLLLILGIRNSQHWELAIDLVSVSVLFPLLILVSSSSDSSPRFAGVSRLLGNASYAIYILHVPAASVFDHAWVQVRKATTEHDAPFSGVVFTILIVAVSVLIDRTYDAPVRAWLNRRMIHGSKSLKLRAPRFG